MKTKIIIEIDTKFRTVKDLDDGEDSLQLTEELETMFHRQIFKVIEEHITDEDFAYDVLEDEELAVEGYEDFSDYGKIEIKITKAE